MVSTVLGNGLRLVFISLVCMHCLNSFHVNNKKQIFMKNIYDYMLRCSHDFHCMAVIYLLLWVGLDEIVTFHCMFKSAIHSRYRTCMSHYIKN